MVVAWQSCCTSTPHPPLHAVAAHGSAACGGGCPVCSNKQGLAPGAIQFAGNCLTERVRAQVGGALGAAHGGDDGDLLGGRGEVPMQHRPCRVYKGVCSV